MTGEEKYDMPTKKQDDEMAEDMAAGDPKDFGKPASSGDDRPMTKMVTDPEEAQEVGYFGQVTEESEREQAKADLRKGGAGS